MRIWPLDFSEFYLEAKHEGPVTSVDISWDGIHVTCGVENCSIGMLNMSTNAYKTILRAHMGDVIGLDVQTSTGAIGSISRDNTIRVWNPASFEEMYEFNSP